MNVEQRQDFISGMRELLDIWETNPELQIPLAMLKINHCASGKTDMMLTRRLMSGTWNKKVGNSYFELIRYFGTIEYSIFVSREQVCEKKKVDTIVKKVEEYDPAILATIPKVTRTVIEDVYEWVCPDSLSDDKPAPAKKAVALERRNG